jgi:hypothetical protein
MVSWMLRWKDPLDLGLFHVHALIKNREEFRVKIQKLDA